MAKELGKHDFYGWFMQYDLDKAIPGNWSTVSAGCFELIQASKGKLKKGKSKVRVSGPVHLRTEIVAKCREVCAQLDAGTYTGHKHVKVWE